MYRSPLAVLGEHFNREACSTCYDYKCYSRGMLALLFDALVEATKSVIRSLLDVQLFCLLPILDVGPRETDSLPAADVQFVRHVQNKVEVVRIGCVNVCSFQYVPTDISRLMLTCLYRDDGHFGFV